MVVHEGLRRWAYHDGANWFVKAGGEKQVLPSLAVGLQGG